MFPVEPKDASVVGLLKKAVHSEKHLWDLFKVNADQLKVYMFDSNKTQMNEVEWWKNDIKSGKEFVSTDILKKMKPSATVSFSYCVVQVPYYPARPPVGMFLCWPSFVCNLSIFQLGGLEYSFCGFGTFLHCAMISRCLLLTL